MLQGDTVVSRIPTEIQREVVERLAAVSARMGLKGNVLWETLTRQAYLEWVDVIIVVAALLSLVLVYFLTEKGIAAAMDADRSIRRGDFASEFLLVKTIVLFVIGVVGVLLFFLHLGQALSTSLNAEYWALIKLIDLMEAVR
jgi:hypothetical protein